MAIGVYVHIPFCDQKCSYCDFNSAVYQASDLDAYMTLLEHEADLLLKAYGRMSAETVFIGGGTPTVLEPEQIHRLGQLLDKTFDLKQLVEFTFEANPESVTLEKATAFKAIGANRVSVGLQTANPLELKTIGRIHSYETFVESYEILRSAGYTNINIDLMIGLPGQTETSYLASLKQVVAFQPEHLSAYGLILEEGTPMENLVSKGLLTLPEESLERKLYHETVALLKAAGYEQYEISNFSKKGCECLHNLGYWTGKPYAALGLGAHGFLEGRRYENPESLSVYTLLLQENQLPMTLLETVTPESSVKEELMLRFRLTAGVDHDGFFERHRIRFESVFKEVTQAMVAKNWVVSDAERTALTPEGMDFCNSVIVAYYEAYEIYVETQLLMETQI